jgi:hypothetical protein
MCHKSLSSSEREHGSVARVLESPVHEPLLLRQRKMVTPRLTDAGAGRRLRWSLDIVELCSDQWAEAAMVGCKKSVLQS